MSEPTTTPPATAQITTMQQFNSWLASRPEAVRTAVAPITARIGAYFEAGQSLAVNPTNGQVDFSGLQTWASNAANVADTTVRTGINTAVSAYNTTIAPAASGGLRGNMWSLILPIVGFLGGNFLGLGTLGSIALALGGALVGGAFLDKPGSFIGQLTGLNRRPPVTPVPFSPTISTSTPTISLVDRAPFPVQAVPLASVTATRPNLPTDAVPLQNPPQPAATDVLRIVPAGSDRAITLIGHRAGGQFIAQGIRVTDNNSSGTGGIVPIQVGGSNGISLPINEAGVVTFDLATTNRIMQVANNSLTAVSTLLPTTPPVLVTTQMTGGTGSPTLTANSNHVVTATQNGGGSAVLVMTGYTSPDNQFFYVTNSQHVADGQTTITGAANHREPVAIPLTNGVLDLTAARAAIIESRRVETTLYTPTRDVTLTGQESISVSGTTVSGALMGGGAQDGLGAREVNFSGTISGTGATRVMTIAAGGIQIDGGATTNTSPITVSLEGVPEFGTTEAEHTAFQNALLTKMRATPGFMDALRNIRSENNIPVVRAPITPFDRSNAGAVSPT